jgi:hypothetical protein
VSCDAASLKHFSALRSVTMLGVHELRQGSLPALPASLQV